MASCIAHKVSYSSSFDIFAMISGVYVWKGHPWYVKWVTRAAAFYVAGFCTVALAAPLIFSPRLGLLEVHLHPWETIGGAISTIG
jgi:hypothetical protein